MSNKSIITVLFTLIGMLLTVMGMNTFIKTDLNDHEMKQHPLTVKSIDGIEKTLVRIERNQKESRKEILDRIDKIK